MNSGAKAAIAVVGIIVALFLAGIVGLFVLGALFVSTARVNIQQNAPVPTVVAPTLQRPNIQPGELIIEVEGQKTSISEVQKAILNNKGADITVEVKGENLKNRPNISD
jgi:hypothetical protein